MTMHKWISTDKGLHCYRCGVALDFGERDEISGTIIWTVATKSAMDEALALCPSCSGPSDDLSHHFVLGYRSSYEESEYYLECAFCDCTIAENDDYSVYVPSPCIEPEPRCDICGESDDGNPPDWNGETGCHLSCEQVAEPYRVRLRKT